MRVEVDALSKRFGRVQAVNAVSFGIEGGHIYGFVGPNGAGKTTTMRMLVTLEDPDSGDARFDGASIRENPEDARRAVGYVPDSLPAYRDMTVHEYLDFFARAYGLRGKKLRTSVGDIEEFAGLTSMLDKPLTGLSKGMKQRVSVGRALVHDPKVLLLDEPAAGLDPRARVELRELLSALSEQGKTILISSHILTELTEICSGVIIIERGRVLADGTVEDILARTRKHKRVSIRCLGDSERVRRELLVLPWVQDARREGDRLVADVDGDEGQLAELLAHLVRQKCPIIDFHTEEADLEDIFMEITRGEVQ